MSTQEELELFEQIYNETYKEVLKFVLYKCNSIDDVDDIIQETYFEVFKMLKKRKEVFDYNKLAYIITIAKNKVIKSYKKNRKLKTVSIFQKKNNEEYSLDIDSRNRFRIKFYYKI